MKSRLPKTNDFYRKHYHQAIYLLMLLLLLIVLIMALVMYQLFHRPLPSFTALDPDQKNMKLTPFTEPNLLPDTIIRWASKAAILAYSFDWVNYDNEISQVRPFFTNGGWDSFLRSINNVIKSVVQGQLFVNGIVNGTPVISNQGPLPSKGQVWRVQIPFLVTYQSANNISKRNFLVTLTIVRISTAINPQGVGIDQFVMVPI